MNEPRQSLPTLAHEWHTSRQFGRYAMRLRTAGRGISSYYEAELTTQCSCGRPTRAIKLTSGAYRAALQFAANVAASLEIHASTSGHAAGCDALAPANRGAV
jgi:hypothetical protein